MRRPKRADVDEGSGSRTNALIECSSCEHPSSMTLDPTLLDSSRLDFELHGDDDVCTVSKSSQYSNDIDTVHEKTQASQRPRKQEEGNDVHGLRWFDKPNTVDYDNSDNQHWNSSDAVTKPTPMRSSSRHKKIQALLGKLNRSTSPPRPTNGIHDRRLLRRTESATHDHQLETRKDLRRSKSACETSSHDDDHDRRREQEELPPMGVSPLSLLRKEMQKNQKRIPIRTLRIQQRATIIIQSCSRRFLARCKFQRLRVLEDYLQYRRAKTAHDARIEVHRLEYEDKLISIQRQTEDDINTMRGEMERGKEILKAILHEANTEYTPSGLDSLEDVRYPPHIHNEVVSLQEEQRMLLGEISSLEEMTLELEEERETLASTNEQIMTMFMVLHDYARSSVAQKEGLEEAARTYNRFEVDKVRQEIRLCSTASSVETAAKNVYRNCIYQHIYSSNSMAMSPNSADLFEKSMRIVRDCEDYLGNPLLDEEAAMALRNEVTRDDSDSSESDSDSESEDWDS